VRRPPTHDLAALRALYAEADRALDGWTCDLSSDCCHFARTGREPYLWPNEWALLQRAFRSRGLRFASPPARQSRVGPPRRGTKRGSLPVLDERRCPLLGRDGRCTVYDDRPFGCRTFFCERGVGPTRKPPRDVLSDIGRRIAALAEKTDPEGDGPRPLSSLLERRR
jgi:Fe-S-cluster containining protein